MVRRYQAYFHADLTAARSPQSQVSALLFTSKLSGKDPHKLTIPSVMSKRIVWTHPSKLLIKFFHDEQTREVPYCTL